MSKVEHTTSALPEPWTQSSCIAPISVSVKTFHSDAPANCQEVIRILSSLRLSYPIYEHILWTLGPNYILDPSPSSHLHCYTLVQVIITPTI